MVKFWCSSFVTACKKFRFGRGITRVGFFKMGSKFDSSLSRVQKLNFIGRTLISIETAVVLSRIYLKT